VFLTRVLTALVAALATFVMTSHVPALAVVNVFMIGAVGFMLVAILQGQLLDAGGRAPTLTSAAVHSAFNAGNALGPLAGGLAISGGLGYAAAPAAGAVLSTAGLLVAAQRRRRRQTDRTPS